MSVAVPHISAFVGYYDEQGHWRSAYLNKSHFTIGRGDTCDIILNDPKASSQHADLYFCTSAWMIADHGSRNGLYVNNQRVDQAVVLRHLDTLQIGSHVLYFRFSSDAGQPTLQEASGPRQLALTPATATATATAAPAAIALSPRQAERAHSALSVAHSTPINPGAKPQGASPAVPEPASPPVALERKRPDGEALQRRIDELSAALDEQRGQTAIAQGEATDWLKQLHGLRGELEQQAQQIQEAAARDRRLRLELEHAATAELALRSELVALQLKLDGQERALLAQSNAAAQERHAYRQDTAELRGNLSALTATLADCEKLARGQKATIAERDYRVQRQSEELDSLRRSYDQLNAELAESQRRRSEHGAQTRALRETLERSSAEYEARLASGERERRRMARQIDQLTAERATAAQTPSRSEAPAAAPTAARPPAVLALHKTVPTLHATAERALWFSIGKRALDEPALDDLKQLLEQLYAYSGDLMKLVQEERG